MLRLPIHEKTGEVMIFCPLFPAMRRESFRLCLPLPEMP